jgi:hypothetical protein
MTILNRKLWVGLFILGVVALISSAAVFGGIEWALASLGMITLTGIAGTGIYIAIKVMRYSRHRSIYDGRLEYSSISAVNEGGGSEYIAGYASAEVSPIGKEDKRLIMKHIDELFEITREQSKEKPVEAAPISEEDKRLIMAHIDKLFKTDWEQSQQMLS